MQPEMYRYWPIICNKYSTPKCDVNNRGNGQGGEGDGAQQGYIGNLYSAQFFYEPKVALKNRSLGVPGWLSR